MKEISCTSGADWEFQKQELAKIGIFTAEQIEEEYEKGIDVSMFCDPVEGSLFIYG